MSTAVEVKAREGWRWTVTIVAGATLGAAAFVYGLAIEPVRAWQAYQVNFVYWTGLTFAMLVIPAILRITDAERARRTSRLAEAGVALVPVVLVAYVGVILGHGTLFPAAWGRSLAELPEPKRIWLEPVFLLVRDGVALALLAAFALGFTYHGLRPALGATVACAPPRGASPVVRWLCRGFGDEAAERARSKHAQTMLAPPFAIVFAFALTLLAFDQVMALDPDWRSTLFGAYYFMTSLFVGWATVALVAVVLVNRPVRSPLTAYASRITPRDRHDFGKLLFMLCMLAADFFWSQYLVIWYGDLPEETTFVIRRTFPQPWQTFAWIVLIGGYALSFTALLFVWVKRTRWTLGSVAVLILVTMWIERFLLVAPATWRGGGFPLGVVEVGLAIGFLAVAAGAYLWGLGAFFPSSAAETAAPREEHHA